MYIFFSILKYFLFFFSHFSALVVVCGWILNFLQKKKKKKIKMNKKTTPMH